MTPTTKAGRVLAGRLAVLESQSVRREATPAVIVAIEQEAVAAERARLRTAVEELPIGTGRVDHEDGDHTIVFGSETAFRAAVLALLEPGS